MLRRTAVRYRLFLRGDPFMFPVQSLLSEGWCLLYALSLLLSRGMLGKGGIRQSRRLTSRPSLFPMDFNRINGQARQKGQQSSSPAFRAGAPSPVQALDLVMRARSDWSAARAVGYGSGTVGMENEEGGMCRAENNGASFPFFERRKSASTTSGSNCVPRCFTISSSAPWRNVASSSGVTPVSNS